MPHLLDGPIINGEGSSGLRTAEGDQSVHFAFGGVLSGCLPNVKLIRVIEISSKLYIV